MSTSNKRCQRSLGENPELEALRVEVDGATVEVFLTGAGEVPPIEDLEDLLAEGFDTAPLVRVEHAATEVVTYSDEAGRSE